MRQAYVIGLILASNVAVGGLWAQSVSNGTFATDVGGWGATSKSAVTWDALDADGDPGSGSAVVENRSDTSNDSTGAVQCLEGLVDGAVYRFSADILVPGGQVGTGRAHLLVQWYDDFCGGHQTGAAVASAGVRTSTPGEWRVDRGTVQAPTGTRFARLRLSVWKDAADGSLKAQFDNVAFDLAGERLAFVPAAGLAEGAEGSFWVTDLEVNNPGTDEMTYRLWWLPRGEDSFRPAVSQTFTLAPGESRRHDDVVGEVFGLDAEDGPFGAVAIASEAPGALAMARVFNRPGVGGGGTFGQSIPGVALDGMIPSGERRRILFLSENTGHRANLGCQNGTGNDLRVTVRLFSAAGARLATTGIDLQPFSNDQLNRVFESWAPVAGYADVWSDTPGAAFTCYGSLLDNVSSDPTTILPQ